MCNQTGKPRFPSAPTDYFQNYYANWELLNCKPKTLYLPLLNSLPSPFTMSQTSLYIGCSMYPCLSILFILYIACRRLVAGLAVSFWLAFVAISVLYTQVVCDHRAEARLCNNKPFRQPFWVIFDSTECCEVSTGTTPWSYSGSTWLDGPLKYYLGQIRYLVSQQCHMSTCGDFWPRRITLDPLSQDHSELAKFIFIICMAYQLLVEMSLLVGSQV